MRNRVPRAQTPKHKGMSAPKKTPVPSGHAAGLSRALLAFAAAVSAFGSIALGAACARSSGPTGPLPFVSGGDSDASASDDAATGSAASDDSAYFGPIVLDGGAPSVQYAIFPDYPSASLAAGAIPPGTQALFGAASLDPAAGPVLVYPTPGTVFPPNMASVLFQWRSAGSAFWLHFVEGSRTLDVYTDGRNATCDQAATGGQCWESSETDLMRYLGMAANGGIDIGVDVTFSIASLDLAHPSTMRVSPTYTIHVAKTAITGAVYYWSTTSKGIRRSIFESPLPADGGPVRAPGPIDYITNAVYPPTTEGTATRCAACHTLSRDGTKLSVSLNGDVLGIIDVVASIPPPVVFGPPSKGFQGSYIGSSWSTFSSDDKRIVTASTGVMTLRNVATGQPSVGTGVIPLPAATAGSMPDWSPDQQHLVFASTPISPPNMSYGRHLYGSSIAMLTASGSGFANYEVVAASTQTNCVGTLPDGTLNPAYATGARETYANPMFSYDDKWLVFSRAECESEADPTAELILAPAQASAPLNHLVSANRQVGDKQVIDVTNGMPVWGPTNDPKIRWIAFTSTRDYGVVLMPGSKIGTNLTPPFPGSGVRQLWIAAVDLTKLASGDVTAIDPSYPAFRFSAQDLTENNHRPFWTVDTLPTWNNGTAL